MSEYIEREALREELRHCCIVAFDEKSGEPYVIDIPQLLRRTTVPAEVVVHCGECQHSSPCPTDENSLFCLQGKSGTGYKRVNKSHYCSYGERRESEAGK